MNCPICSSPSKYIVIPLVGIPYSEHTTAVEAQECLQCKEQFFTPEQDQEWKQKLKEAKESNNGVSADTEPH